MCFGAWIAARGGVGSVESAAAIAQVQHFIETHGEARFTPWHGDPAGRPTSHRGGYRRADDAGGVEYYVRPEVFRREVCAGHNPQFVARALEERGLLLRGQDGKVVTPAKPPTAGKTLRLYRIASAILGGDDA